MDGSLLPGQLLQAIWTKNLRVEVDTMSFDMEPLVTCLSLIVFMEKGQMSEVPWVKAEFDDGTTKMFNVAMLQGYSPIIEKEEIDGS